MPISFCLPKEHFPDPAWIDAWERDQILPLEEKGKGATAQCWIYQTWALLIKARVPCYLLEGLPRTGSIIIAMSGSFPSIVSHLQEEMKKAASGKSWLCNFFLVDIVADGLPHPAAHLHLVQNRAHAERLPRSLFIPHWPQPHLIPRDPVRGSLFKKISFFGDSNNLAPELCSPQWQERLQKELGMTLEIRGAHRWHDYHDVDGVIAIRDFSRSRHLEKPATKLYNAWHAGVPFIGGRDSAYAADGHPGQDYLVGTSPENVFQHLKKLQEDTDLRARLVQQGFQAGAAYTREAILDRWKKLFQTTLPAYALKWQKASAWQRSYFDHTQELFCFWDRVIR
ncbi:MAG: glycosyltransferase [Chthoniobacterales bacterium]